MMVKLIITYAALMWWPKIQQKNVILKLSKVQTFVCLTTPSATLEVLLNIPPFSILKINESARHMEIPKHVEILRMRTDHMSKRHHLNKSLRL